VSFLTSRNTRHIQSRTASAPRWPLLANPNLFHNPNMVFESTYLCTATTKSLFPMAPEWSIPRSNETETPLHSRLFCIHYDSWRGRSNDNNNRISIASYGRNFRGAGNGSFCISCPTPVPRSIQFCRMAAFLVAHQCCGVAVAFWPSA